MLIMPHKRHLQWPNLPFDTYHIWWGKAIKCVGLDLENLLGHQAMTNGFMFLTFRLNILLPNENERKKNKM